MGRILFAQPVKQGVFSWNRFVIFCEPLDCEEFSRSPSRFFGNSVSEEFFFSCFSLSIVAFNSGTCPSSFAKMDKNGKPFSLNRLAVANCMKKRRLRQERILLKKNLNAKHGKSVENFPCFPLQERTLFGFQSTSSLKWCPKWYFRGTG